MSVLTGLEVYHLWHVNVYLTNRNMQCKGDILLNRTQRKNGSFVSLSCLLPELGSFRVTNSSFFVFSADGSKKVVTTWTKYLMQQKNLIESFQKMAQLISCNIKGRNIRKTVESA